MKNRYRQLTSNAICIMTIAATSSVVFTEVQAQALEEIVVTAQRREESLQTVPVSVNVYTGAQIELQGFKNLDDLARFSTTVNMSEGASTQETTIRGFGTSGASMTLQSATPMFVDGIHFGSLDMVKNAFMDMERAEVLNGPQPLHFGMDASAGAFNIISKRPTDSWEGDLSAEFGNDGKRELFAAFGGPISDTLGIRTAVSQDVLEGVLKSRVDGSKFPEFNSLGGRVMLEWDPTDRFNLLTKFEINRQRNGGEIGAGCIAEGDPTGYAEMPLSGYQAGTDTALSANVYVPESAGGLSNGSRLGIVQFDPKYTGEKCFDDEYGVSRNGPWASPLITNIVRDGLGTVFDGAIDVAALQQAFHSQEETSYGDVIAINGVDGFGNKGKDAIDSYHVLLDGTYTLANGVTINSQSAYVNFGRRVNADGRNAPFADHNQFRRVTQDQHSQQIRIESPADGYDINVDIPGGLTMNYMVGGFYQQWDKDVLINLIKGDFRQGQRFMSAWEDAEFWSGFWGIDLKFMDDQLSVQVGGRYSDVSKEVFLQGYGAAFIYDEVPCDSAGTNSNPATCTPDPHFKRVHPNLTTFTVVDPITGRGAPTGNALQRQQRQVRVDSPRIFLEGVDMNNLWTQTLWNVRANAAVPLNYRGAQAQAVGLTAPVFANANGPFGACDTCIDEVVQEADNYSSQIVVSLTPDRFDGRHTFYGKFAEGFKGPVTDTGTATLPANMNEIYFTPEYSESWEIGARGSLLDGQARYGVTGFMTEFTDLQTTSSIASYDPNDIIDQSGVSLNAGSQKVDGMEFNLDYAATDNLVLNMAGSLLHARYSEFDGTGCNNSEIVAASINAVENPSGRSAAELSLANDILGNMGPLAATLPSASEIPQELLRNGGCRLADTAEFAAGDSSIGAELTYNRAGFEPAFAPDYKVVLGATYTRPVLGNFEIMLNAQGYIEAEKIVITGEFDRSRVYEDGHWDVNLMAGIGPQDGSWRLISFVRNLMEDKIVFRQEYDLTRSGIVFADDRGLSKASFMSYGVRFEYNYR